MNTLTKCFSHFNIIRQSRLVPRLGKLLMYSRRIARALYGRNSAASRRSTCNGPHSDGRHSVARLQWFYRCNQGRTLRYAARRQCGFVPLQWENLLLPSAATGASNDDRQDVFYCRRQWRRCRPRRRNSGAASERRAPGSWRRATKVFAVNRAPAAFEICNSITPLRASFVDGP